MELPDGPWLDRLNPEFLARTYPAWNITAASFEDAVTAFREHGFAALAALDEGLIFEPAYFRETNPAFEHAGDVECYRHWLVEGLAAGAFGSARAHLRSLGLAIDAYPAGFAWQYYTRLRPRAGAHRWAALDDFCQDGFATYVDLLPIEPEGFAFLLALGRKYSTVNDAFAIRAYEIAESYHPLLAAERQHLADAYLRQGLWRPALRLYDHIAGNGEANGWTVRNFVKCAARLEAWSEMLAGLERARREQAGDPLWDATIADAVSNMFENHARSARMLMAASEYGAAEMRIGAAVEALAALVEKLTPLPARVAPGLKRRVLIVANADDTESAARRVTEKLSLLALAGVACETCAYGDVGGQIARLPDFSAVLLFRVPALPDVIRFIVAARRLGVVTVFESDVALPEADAAPAIEFFRGKVTAAQYDGMRFGLQLHRAAARLCDFSLAPTEALATALRPLARGRRCFVLPNSLLPEAAPERGPAGAPLRVFIRAATLEFMDAAPGTIGAALLGLLNHRADFVLLVSGPLVFDPAFDGCAGRLIHTGQAAVPVDYWPHLAGADLSLVMPCGTVEQEYRAEVNWAEAACAGVASLLFIQPGRLPAIGDGVNALRAAGAQAWAAAFESLLDDAALRERLSARALRDVEFVQGQHIAAQAMQRMFGEVMKAPDVHAPAY
jgi:hypothetical protein